MASFRGHASIGAAVSVILWVAAVCFARGEIPFAAGTGEPNDPYQIATAEQLIGMGQDPNLLDRHFILIADIDLAPGLPGGKVFNRAVIAPTADGTEPNAIFRGTAFSGAFDGNDHTISNLTVQGVNYLGLFGRISGSVKRLKLVNIEVSGAGHCIGGLMGYNAGDVIQCHGGGLVHGNTYVGGLVGVTSRTVTQCYSDGASTGNDRVGGLAGHNSGDIITSHSSSVVVGGGGRIGGLVGYNSARISASWSTGAVTGTDEYVGGLAGLNDRGSIIASCSTGSVNGNECVGGLVGGNDFGSIIAGYSTGRVVGANFVGGFAGYTQGDIVGSYSVGQIDGTAEYVGGFVGRCLGRTTACFWDIESSGTAKSGKGIGETTAQMQDIATFLAFGWDFVDETTNGTCDFWESSPGGYPQLLYCGGEGPVMPQGQGTPEEPYLIRDGRDLGTMWFKPSAHYRLEASVDLSGITWSTAVVPLFEGSFDGGGHAISNLRIRGRAYLGLFGKSEPKATISNLRLEAVDIEGTDQYVAGLVGYNRGGIAGVGSTGSVTGNHSIIGGLAGYNGDSITGCYSTCAVVGTNEYGDGSTGSNDDPGRPPGFGPGSAVGGLVGLNYGSIAMSYSNGPVSGTGGAIGGLVGNDHWGRIAASYSSGAVRGGMAVGGLVGVEYANVTRSSFWDITASGRAKSVCGTGKTTAEMQTAATFIDAGWDFESVWTICEGRDYPRLQWENVDCGDEPITGDQ